MVGDNLVDAIALKYVSSGQRSNSLTAAQVLLVEIYERRPQLQKGLIRDGVEGLALDINQARLLRKTENRARDEIRVAAQRDGFAGDRWWKRTRRGNSRVMADGLVIVVRASGERWEIRFAHQNVDDWKSIRRSFSDQRSARLAVFDMLVKRRAKRGEHAPLGAIADQPHVRS